MATSDNRVQVGFDQQSRRILERIAKALEDQNRLAMGAMALVRNQNENALSDDDENVSDD